MVKTLQKTQMDVSKIIERINPFKKVEGKSSKRINANYWGGGNYRTLLQMPFNGEKNLGEIGPIKSYRLDYMGLSFRSWQSYLESEITQTVINKYITWVIGKGLKLQSEPMKDLLASEKITINSQEFSSAVESRFCAFSKSKNSHYSGMLNLNLIQALALKNAIVGGDVLVILRYENDCVNVQLVDGYHVISPLYGDEYYPKALSNGNRIENGIELSPKNEHVAYYVKRPGIGLQVDRVPAKGESSGLTMAFLVYGSEYRLDNVRGMPLISVVLETLKKLERYKEATVGSAEERQKIPYFIKHELGSTGESPLTNQMSKAYDADSIDNDLPRDVQGKQLADTVAATTNKMTYNMPVGSALEALESKNELHFKDFYTVNIDLICASIEIPPNVAMSKYESNFSASRAALKDWEHTLHVKRDRFAFQFMQPIYDFWLETEILKNKIQAVGYLIARLKNNYMVLEGYRSARFVGAPVPHIDPLKEVAAERLKLGTSGAAIPLTTVESATEKLNEGESDSNMEQYAEELAESIKLKLVAPEPAITAPPEQD